jgi:hypothetical protein
LPDDWGPLGGVWRLRGWRAHEKEHEMSRNFGPVWQRTVGSAGQGFKTVKGLPFTYEVNGQVVRVSRADQNLSRSEFEKAYNLMPLRRPGQINRIVRGPAYVYAILTDPRISLGPTTVESNE